MKEITRRALGKLPLAAALVSAGGLTSKGWAQTPAAADSLQAAKERIKAAGDTLAKEQVPMATEPAFQFKV